MKNIFHFYYFSLNCKISNYEKTPEERRIDQYSVKYQTENLHIYRS